MGKICKNCKWAKEADYPHTLSCYYNPPVIINTKINYLSTGQNFYVTQHPPVFEEDFCSKFEAKDGMSEIPTNHYKTQKKIKYLSSEEENFLCQTINDLSYSYSIIDKKSKKSVMVELDESYLQMISKFIIFAKLQRFSDLNDGYKMEFLNNPEKCIYYIFYDMQTKELYTRGIYGTSQGVFFTAFISREVAEEALKIYGDQIKQILKQDNLK